MLRACSSAISMSAARCCKAWKLPIGTPNCRRVLRYSTVMLGERRHRAHRLGGKRRDRLVDHALDQRQRRARLRRCTLSGPTATEASEISAARMPSWVG